MNETTLLSLASRQVWPHVLAISHLRPAGVALLHSPEPEESLNPARRLLDFLNKNAGQIGIRRADLFQVPFDDFGGVRTALDECVARLSLNTTACVMNITGGNKLMATAAFEWAKGRGMPVLYLERGNKLVRIGYGNEGANVALTETLAPGIANSLDAMELLKCQLGPAVLTRQPERLTLNDAGRSATTAGIMDSVRKRRLQREDFLPLLAVQSRLPERENKHGDGLEYAVAAMLLKLGVPAVYRSVELKSGEATRLAEGELDLVFNWNGRLWVVDCKDQASGGMKVNNLREKLAEMRVDLAAIRKDLEAIERAIELRDVLVLRQDLQQVGEVGGLLGTALAVRSSPLPAQALEFADSRGPKIEVIPKDRLEERLRALLLPDERLDFDDLRRLIPSAQSRRVKR